jgi:hypothetical protein
MIDVVNEPLHAPPSYKDALGGDGTTGWDWMITAFQLARTYFPDAELILNDYQILHGPEFTQEYMVLIDLLQTRGLIDAIGEEGHFLEKTAPAMIQTNLDTLATTGLPIYITEFDLDIASSAQHANVLRELFPVFWEHAAVQGVTHWGYRQGSMWRPDAWLLRSDGIERAGLRWLICYLEGGGDDCDTHVPVYTPSGWQGDANGLTLEAELYDEGSGVLALGDQVAYTNDGDWIKFTAVEFQDTWDKLKVRYAKGDDNNVPAASISIHFGSLENPAEETIDLPSTGDWGVFDTIEIDWAVLSGTEDVYIQFNNDPDAVGNIDYVRFFASVPSGGGNLVPDGGFEVASVPSGWGTWFMGGTTLSISTAKAFAGSNSLLASTRATNSHPTFLLTSLVGSGIAYGVSAHALHMGAGNDTISLTAQVGCTVGSDIFTTLTNATNVAPDTWTELSGAFTVPASCVPDEVRIYFEGTTVGVDVYIDEVSVIPLENQLVPDGGFEVASVPSGWGTWFMGGTTLSISTAKAFAGSNSLLASTRATNSHPTFLLTSLVQAGSAYVVSARGLHMGAGTDTITMTAQIGCTVGSDIFTTLTNATNVAPDTWTLLSGGFAISSTCVPDEVRIYFEGTTVGVDVHIDEVSVLGP